MGGQGEGEAARRGAERRGGREAPFSHGCRLGSDEGDVRARGGCPAQLSRSTEVHKIAHAQSQLCTGSESNCPRPPCELPSPTPEAGQRSVRVATGGHHHLPEKRYIIRPGKVCFFERVLLKLGECDLEVNHPEKRGSLPSDMCAGLQQDRFTDSPYHPEPTVQAGS